MQSPWKKLENENGFPFYFNENTKQQQWDHPKFLELKHLIDDCNYVKYSKYRVALKVRVLQKALFMEGVALGTVMGVFARHQLGVNESSLCLESYDLEAVLFDIFFAVNKQNQRNIDVDFAVELMQNFLYNIYDKERQVKIQVSSTKLALALLSDCDLHELHNVIFTLCADHNNCVTRLRLQSLLTKLVAIAIFMHEDVSFGQHLVNSTIENCFSNVRINSLIVAILLKPQFQSPGLVGLCESNFMSWLEEAPQLLCWVPIVHRIKSCELDSSREFTFNFIKKLCGLMPCSVKLNQTDNGVVETKAVRELHRILLFGTHNEKEIRKYLEDHKIEVATQIHKLKILKEYLQLPPRNALESTPMVGVVKCPKRSDLERMLSPILQMSECNESNQHFVPNNPKDVTQESLPYSVNDISTWLKDQPTSSKSDTEALVRKSPVRELHNDLDDALAKLQQILANNFTLDGNADRILNSKIVVAESLGSIDNSHLKHAVSEVEGMLTSFIDNVESSRASSVQPLKQS
ncbi:dystrophin, isoform E-like [Asbolus verrucosus]|uniref:Dystrophin, isoform E-like n=1 Tax=Asbolus verrucosus TaxID=1661398 RepID=A0A482W354_ASBVE|nr:dystrophin, isoform E-like [Asbolus verrucosus]